MATQSAVAGVPQYRGIVHCLTSIVRDEGGIRSGYACRRARQPPLVHHPHARYTASALYRGMSPTLLAIAPYVGLNFAIYESLKTWCLARGWTVRGRDSLSVRAPVLAQRRRHAARQAERECVRAPRYRQLRRPRVSAPATDAALPAGSGAPADAVSGVRRRRVCLSSTWAGPHHQPPEGVRACTGYAGWPALRGGGRDCAALSLRGDAHARRNPA